MNFIALSHQAAERKASVKIQCQRQRRCDVLVIHGISAWEYHCTPPAVKSVAISSKLTTMPPPVGIGMPESLLKPRSNACEASRLVSGRLLFDLKGVSLPIHIFVDKGHSLDRNRLVKPSRLPKHLPTEELIPLGRDIFVTSPRLTLLHLARELSWASLGLLMLEACGIYAVFRGTRRSHIVLEDAARAYANSSSLVPRAGVCEFYNENGNRSPMVDAHGDSLQWAPCINRLGKMTELWKRPPITSKEEIAECILMAPGIHGGDAARKAARVIQDGCGSPLEAKLFLILCASAHEGGEHWKTPFLNMRVPFSLEAQELSGQSYCICDFLWPDRKGVIEAKGKGYHADREGFEVENGRRAALESMGYTVLDITYSQMANLNRLETMLELFSIRLNLPLRQRTTAFLARRKALHQELFASHDHAKSLGL